MAESVVLQQNSVVQGDRIVVTKTIEEKLTGQDLFNAKQTLQYQREGIQKQVESFNAQLAELDARDKELDMLLKQLTNPVEEA